MTELQKLRAEFINEILVKLMPYGFTKKAGQDIYRQSIQGRDYLHLAFIAHPGIDFDVSIDIAIRNDSLERFIDEVGTVPPSERKGAVSIGVGVANLTKGKWLRWTVSARPDISPMSMDVMRMYEEVAIPYFNQFSTLEAIYDVCCRDDEYGRLHRPLTDVRAIKAVCAAYLLGKREEYNELVTRKRELLLRRDKSNMSEFLSIVEKIDRMW